MKAATLLLVTAVPLVACGQSGAKQEARYDAGYSDGYAVGFNTTCQIRATLVEGAWDDPDYSRGYADGQTAGSIACLNTQKAE